MSRASGSEARLRELLLRARVPPRLPEAVRARALTRARKTVSAPFYVLATPIPPPARFTRHALIAAALVLGMGGVAFALNARWKHQSAPAVASPVAGSLPAKAVSSETVPLAHAPTIPSAQQPPSRVEDPNQDGARASRPESSLKKYGAERELMHRAHSAFAEGDFGATLKLLAEHARRFPRGQLAEEREALRVRSLASAGRIAEARRAAQAFADHFPRSVLLARIQQIAGGKADRDR
ncbi:MAG TPA: hypothetical protein VFQ61_16610 [Polyangiaceae bacterium]|nr:hypothetical protein [Polyangiaceae bacterium]